MITRNEDSKGFVSSGFGFGSLSPSTFGGFGGGSSADSGPKDIKAAITRGRLRGGNNSRRRFPKQQDSSSDDDSFSMPEMPKMFGGGGDNSDPFKEMAAG